MQNIFQAFWKHFMNYSKKYSKVNLDAFEKKKVKKWQKIKVWPWKWADTANMRSKFTLEYFCELVCKKHETTSGTHANIIVKFEEW